MAKLTSFFVVLTLIGLAAAEPARLRDFRQSRFFARQQVAEDVPAQTPYPPSGIKPDIPFELPNEPQESPEQPDQPLEPEQPQEPDNTYLPPDNLLPPAQTYGPPDQFYGPPEASGDGEVNSDDNVANVEQPEEGLAAEEPEAEEIEDPQSERLVLARAARRQSIRPAILRSAKLRALPVRSQKLIAQPVYSANGSLLAFKILRV